LRLPEELFPKPSRRQSSTRRCEIKLSPVIVVLVVFITSVLFLTVSCWAELRNRVRQSVQIAQYASTRKVRWLMYHKQARIRVGGFIVAHFGRTKRWTVGTLSGLMRLMDR
ncbi:hypothetical protein LINGRAHAP2_LOCUS4376, partial [Linum grandiflorum]